MSSIIADLPFDDRPRERMMQHGCEALSDAELLALVIGSGKRGRNAIEVARELLREGVAALARQDWNGMASVSGIGPAKATRIRAAIEFGRRATVRDHSIREALPSIERLAERLTERHAHQVQERVGAIYLDSRMRIIKEREIYVGTLSQAFVSPRDVFRWALLDAAAAVIVFHNHPSGDPNPSPEDIALTKTFNISAKALDVELIDHLILGSTSWVSMRERKLIPSEPPRPRVGKPLE
jgi:DNA repair protein RadC